MGEMVLVLWPDGPRRVPAERIIGWAQDEHADSDRSEAQPRTLEDAVAWLTATGTVTFGKE